MHRTSAAVVTLFEPIANAALRSCSECPFRTPHFLSFCFFWCHNGRGCACSAHKSNIVCTTRSSVQTRTNVCTRRLQGPKIRGLHRVTKSCTTCYIFTVVTSYIFTPCSLSVGRECYPYSVTTSSSRFTKSCIERVLPHSHPISISCARRNCGKTSPCLCARHGIATIAL